MNVYDEHYFNLESLRERIKAEREAIEEDRKNDKRIMDLIHAEEFIKKAMMKGTIYK